MKSNYRSPLFRQLRDELIRGANRDQRLAHVVRAEQLLSELDSGATHPYEFYHWRITRTRPPSSPEVGIPVQDARHDICRLVEEVSDSANVSVDSAEEKVLTVPELAKLFNVTPKTVSRWRLRGLAGRRFVFQGRKRLGFLRSSVARFLHRNAAQVRRSGRFRKLTGKERAEIVDRARTLVASGLPPVEVVRVIGQETGRCSETVRATIRQHDRQHAAEAVFPAPGRALSKTMNEQLYAQYRRGKSLAAMARTAGQPRLAVSRAIRAMRAERIAQLPLEYMPSPEFDRPDAESEILASVPEAGQRVRKPRPPSEVPSYLASLYEIPLLTPRQERHLFRKFNYLKYRAAKLRETLDPAHPDSRVMDEIERLHEEAVATKNELVRANLRLVVSIAKQYVTRQEQFFDLVSDGNMSLIRAVEKFDYTLGNKFSTYASWAIKKNYARTFAVDMRRQDRFRTSHEELLSAEMEHRADPYEQESTQRRREQEIDCLLSYLDERERRVITSRFGLGSTRRPRTLQEVGVEFGVSKERIRQIEARAISKLREAAAKESIESPAV